MASMEREIRQVANEISALGSRQRSSVFAMSWWSDQLLGWAMRRPDFKTQLFRFVDVFPAMTDDDDVLRHIDEYFPPEVTPPVLRTALRVAHRLPRGERIAASVARRNIERMADQFIVGHDPDAAADGLAGLWDARRAFTVDLLGEKTIVASDADRYAARVHEMVESLADRTASWQAHPTLERDHLGPLARVNVSIKPTALATHFHPLSRAAGLESASHRLRPILHAAQRHGAHVHFDMEHYEVKDLTLALFRDLAAEFPDLSVGIVVQTYLRDSWPDLRDLIAFARDRPVPVTVRLVKGAYWDTETVEAQAEGWPVPVWQHKDETDANFERCAALLLDNHDRVRAAFGSHNLRSLAHAIVYARSLGLDDRSYEVQMLYGMAEPLQHAIAEMGMRLRIYAPVGELVPGMAYLVRRLLENTSNESFVRARFAEGRELDQLLAAPEARLPEAELRGSRPPLELDDPYRPEPFFEWRQPGPRARMGAAVSDAPASFPLGVPAVIAGRDHDAGATRDSVDPANPSTVVAVAAECGVGEADAAVEAARVAFAKWATTPPAERAAVLCRAAEFLRAGRARLASLMVFEAGKPWAEADADVCEAIDFCEYYAREMIRLSHGGAVQSPPGELNELRYRAKGVVAVIAPWNFPLAIATGMTVAALVAGNTVVLKPAEQTPATALSLVRALEHAGLPPGVLNMVPGPGETVGARLVAHPDVAMIAFTGSREVGLHIIESAATNPGRRHVKRVIAEMGGKNALIIDADADPDQAIPAAIASAFGFAGQKCSALSRLIIVDPLYDQLLDRLVEAASELIVGHPREPSSHVGPLIDRDAFDKVTRWQRRAEADGEVVLAPATPPASGWFASPMVVADVAPDAPLACNEIFGPVLAVMRAATFDDAVRMANDTEYALTGGAFTRSPAHVMRAGAELRAGNIYINRGITGAIVGRHPFGGFGMSGVGSKAGGPDYLLQFVEPVATSENTVRQGFAPPSG